jgi:hypothetical protein
MENYLKNAYAREATSPVEQVKNVGAWKRLTLEDIRTCLYPPQLEALLSAEGPVAGDAMVEAIIEDCLSRVRAEIHGSVRNPLDDNPFTIPPEVRSAAIMMVIQALHCRVPAIVLTQDQKDRIRDAYYLIQRIGRGDLPVTVPLIKPPFAQKSILPTASPMAFLTPQGHVRPKLTRSSFSNL